MICVAWSLAAGLLRLDDCAGLSDCMLAAGAGWADAGWLLARCCHVPGWDGAVKADLFMLLALPRLLRRVFCSEALRASRGMASRA